MDILKTTLSTLNGCILDLESPVGELNIIEGEPTVNKELDVKQPSPHPFPCVQIFEHIDFGGSNQITFLNWKYVGDFWNDKISSLIVISGIWRFYEHKCYDGRFWDLGPGYYRRIRDWHIPNDIISSFKCVKITKYPG